MAGPGTDWTLAGPDRGLRAATHNFSGNRRTTAERILAVAAMLVTALVALAAGMMADRDLAVWQFAVLMLLAIDLGGGVFVNASAAAKRWYHRAGVPGWHHWAFVAVHLHPFLVAWLFPEAGWRWAACLYTATVIAAAAVLCVPLYLRRPVAMALAALILAVLPLAAAVPLHLAWIAPVFVIKLLIAHLLHEEPYAP
jgi:hypothetical protein